MLLLMIIRNVYKMHIANKIVKTEQLNYFYFGNSWNTLSKSMYYVYILECADGTLYAGITTDVTRRVVEHNTSALGASYTRGRRPVTLLCAKAYENRSSASKEEYRLKQLSREEKLEWCVAM